MRIVGSILLLLSSASALCSFPKPQPCSLYHQSKAVFVGKVVSQAKTQSGDYRFEVSRWFKGAMAKSVTVFAEADAGNEKLEAGEEYLVFAQSGDAHHPLLIKCGDAFSDEELPDAIKATEKLQKLQATASANFAVWMYENDAHTQPFTGTATITLKGKTTIQGEAKNGVVTLKVPPGKYQVQIESEAIVEEKAHANDYFKKEEVDLAPGECAIVVLIARGR